MASSYTGLGTELMTTGENAGTWGSTTNSNLEFIEEAIRGYVAVGVASADATLSLTDGSTGDSIRNSVIAFTGALAGNRIITVPAVEKWWIMDNQTTEAYTLTVKASGQTGVTWGTSDKGTKILYANGTDVIDTDIGGVGSYDLNGEELTLDADSDTSITASTDDQIDFEIAGADDFTMTANAFNVLTGSHATFADSANAKFGTGNDMLVYHDGSNSYITNATGALKLATETSGIALTIGHTTSETTIADNLTVTGTLTGTLATAAQGTVTSLGTLTTLTVDNIITNGATIGHTSDTDLLTLADGALTVAGTIGSGAITSTGIVTGTAFTAGSAVLAEAELELLDGLTAGTAIASKVVTTDSSIDTTGQRNLTISGELDAATLDISSSIDIAGASQFSGAVTVGVDDTGLDVKLFGASAGAYALWDESADLLDIRGATAAGAGLLKLTTGELTVVDADKLGRIDFQAPLESDGTDSILVAASIWAEADDTFSASVNNTDIVFATGKSEAAAEKFRFTADNEIGIAGANYGTDGQVLTSGGAGAACAWEDASAGTVTAINNATQSELVTIGSTTTELDAEANLTFTGSALTCIGTITTGVDGTGHDIKFFGDTAGRFLLWDQSDDALELTDSSPIKIGDGGDMTIYHDGTDSFVTNSQGGLKLATETSGIAVTIGHTTSETTVADNLTITGTTVGTTFDVNGTADAIILDTDADTTISSPTDDQIDFEIAGADDFTMTANTFTILSGSTIAIAAGGAITNAGTMAPDISSTGKAMVLGF